MATLRNVINQWDMMPSKNRTRKKAREMAKTIVHKVAGVFGKKYLKSIGEARFLDTMLKNKQ